MGSCGSVKKIKNKLENSNPNNNDNVSSIDEMEKKENK